MRKTLTMTTMALAASVALATGTAGSLDTEFDTDGVVLAGGLGDGSAMDVRAATIQSDGKPIAVGAVLDDGTWRLAARRFHTNGNVDTAYGSGGIAVPLPVSQTSIAFGAALDSQGRLLVTGRDIFDRVVPGKGKKTRIERVSAAVVARLTTSGALDTSFGSGGVAVIESSDASATTGMNVAVLSNGKIVVSGQADDVTDPGSGGGGRKGKKGGGSTSTSSDALLVCRLTSAGALDTSFGSGGLTTDNATTGDEYAVQSGMALQSDGSIVVGAQIRGASDGYVRGYTASGAVDTSFGASGTAPIGNGTLAWGPAVAVDGSDRIVVALGRTNGTGGSNDGAVLRLTSAGLLDTGFGSSGEFRTGLSGDDVLSTVAAASGGTIIAAGTRSRGAAEDAYCLKLTSGGALDSNFGSGGYGDSVLDSDSNVDFVSTIEIGANGDPVIAGNTIVPNVGLDGFVARYCGN